MEISQDSNSTKTWSEMADFGSFLLDGREVPPCTIIVL